MKPTSQQNEHLILKNISCVNKIFFWGLKTTPFLLFILSLIHLLTQKNFTSWEWPTLDMFAFFERKLNPSFLKNDFFTNASSDINPRHFYGNVILILSHTLGISYYSVLYFFKAFFFLTFVPLIYLGMKSVLEFLFKEKITIWCDLALALCSLTLLNDKIMRFMSIAGWQPIVFKSIPTTFACFCAFATFVGIGKMSSNLLMWTQPILWALSVFFHPSVAFFIFIFYLTILFFGRHFKSEIPWKRLKIEGVVFLAGLMGVVFLFRDGSVNIPAIDFIDTYIRLRHPGHFHFGLLGRLSQFEWWETMIIMSSCFILCSMVLRNTKFFLMPITFLFFYLSFIFGQWFFTNVFMVKSIAILSPIRYSFLGYYQILLCFSLTVHQLTKNWIINSSIYQEKNKGIILILLGSTLVASTTFTGLSVDDPKLRARAKRENFLSWIKKTPQDSVFSLPLTFSIHATVRLVGNRAIVVGLDFPLVEKHFYEYGRRFRTFYGEPGKWNKMEETGLDIKQRKIYNSLTWNDFISFAKDTRLDYVVRFSNYPLLSESASDSIVYRDEEFVVYRINFQ